MNQANEKGVLTALANAPAQINIMPDYTAEELVGLASVFAEEGFPMLEILGRPMGKAIDLLASFNERPERSKVYTAIGTLKTRKDAEAVVALKPDLLVSAIFSRQVLDVAVDAGIDYLPAVSTLQDIQNVLEAFDEVGRELSILKVCPVEVVPIGMVNIMANIFPGIRFCPTGTIEIEDIPEWKAMPWMAAPMERWFVPDELIYAHDWDAIRGRLRKIKELAAEGVAKRGDS